MIFTSFYFGINIYVKNKRRIDLLLYFILKKLPLNILLKSIVSNSSRGSRISVPFNIANATHYSDPSLCVTNKQTRYRVFKEFREKTTYRLDLCNILPFQVSRQIDYDYGVTIIW